MNIPAYLVEGSLINIPVYITVVNKKYQPAYMTNGSACFDIKARLEEELVLDGDVTIINTGLYIAIPIGYKMCMAIRSSLAVRGLMLVNSPAQIDSDYRDEVKLIVYSLNDICVHDGDRIAQGWIEPVHRAMFSNVDTFPLPGVHCGLSRTGGLGSTGIR